jgi:hypothetical protein
VQLCWNDVVVVVVVVVGSVPFLFCLKSGNSLRGTKFIFLYLYLIVSFVYRFNNQFYLLLLVIKMNE